MRAQVAIGAFSPLLEALCRAVDVQNAFFWTAILDILQKWLQQESQSCPTEGLVWNNRAITHLYRFRAFSAQSETFGELESPGSAPPTETPTEDTPQSAAERCAAPAALFCLVFDSRHPPKCYVAFEKTSDAFCSRPDTVISKAGMPVSLPL